MVKPIQSIAFNTAACVVRITELNGDFLELPLSGLQVSLQNRVVSLYNDQRGRELLEADVDLAALDAARAACSPAGGGGPGGAAADVEFLTGNQNRVLKWDLITNTFTGWDGSALNPGEEPAVPGAGVITKGAGVVDVNTQRVVLEDLVRNGLLRKHWTMIPGNDKDITYFAAADPRNPSNNLTNIDKVEYKTGAALILTETFTYNLSDLVTKIEAS